MMMGVPDVGCLNKIGIPNRKVVVSACYWKKVVIYIDCMKAMDCFLLRFPAL